ncbi:hypothetical protein JCM11251_000904 [Rhodosporidiobolus azoricus]
MAFPLPPGASPASPPPEIATLPLLESSTSTTSVPTSPVPDNSAVFRKSRTSPAAVAVASLVLVSWIAAALVLHKKRLFLPLDYFGGVAANGDRGITNGTYNTLITLLANLLLALVAYALSLGLRACLRHQLLSPTGVPLNTYDALVKMSSLALQLKWTRSALGVAAVFATAQLFAPATQAAFGTSVALSNLSSPYPLLRLSSQLSSPLFLTSFPLFAAGLPSSQDTDFNLKALWSDPTVDPTSTTKPTALVLQTQEFNGQKDPLWAASYFTQQALGVAEVGVDTTTKTAFSKEEQRLLDASPDVRVYATVEGFLANATCRTFSPEFTHSSLGGDSSLAIYSFDFPCGLATGVYSSPEDDSASIVDTYACDTPSTPEVYIFSLVPSAGTVSFAYRCTLSTSSVLLPVEVLTQTRLARTIGPPHSPVALPTSLGVVKALGAETLNNHGLSGFSALAEGLDGVDLAGFDRQAYLERVLEALAKGMLARVQDFLVNQGVNTREFVETVGLQWEEGTARYQFQSLKLHPTRLQLLWLIPPLLLLLSLLFFALPYVLLTPGQTDFTDPVVASLIALASEKDEGVKGARTAAWANKGFGGEEGGKVRLMFRAVPPSSVNGKDGFGAHTGTSRLEMSTTAGSGRFERVVEGREYV